mmetsp:Transcript_34739/g.53360  ORF Transcript_34739/g.53360 Transcript_34739/m.53360 type:complete len:108 (+) Transcript_34739:1265-1588(+)
MLVTSETDQVFFSKTKARKAFNVSVQTDLVPELSKARGESNFLKLLRRGGTRTRINSNSYKAGGLFLGGGGDDEVKVEEGDPLGQAQDDLRKGLLNIRQSFNTGKQN